MSNNDYKVVVIGLDGMSWPLVDALAERGVIKTLSALRRNATYGKLISTFPPLTAPAWSSFATGKNPGKHGCFDFAQPEGSLSNFKVVNSKRIRGITFYELLHNNGKCCVIINLPISWPPRISEIMLPEILSPTGACLVPPDLIEKIPVFKEYRVVPNNSFRAKGEIIKYFDDITRIEEVRFECARHLFSGRWDFFFILFSGTDWVQHCVYDQLIKGNSNSAILEAAESVFRNIDQYIDWFINKLPENALLLVNSDHGFYVYQKGFCINRWLHSNGYLSLRPVSSKSNGNKISVSIPGLFSHFPKLVELARPLYRKIIKVIPVEISSSAEVLPAKSIAFAFCYSELNIGGIYINDRERFFDGIVNPKERKIQRDKLIKKLSDLKDPYTGEKILTKVQKAEEVYFGEATLFAPDIILTCAQGYRLITDMASPTFVTNLDGERVNGHHLEGIFLAYGSDVARGYEISPINIYDIAPTILHIMDHPIPSDMDGRVLTEIFKPGSPLDRAPKIIDVAGESLRVREKIKKLRTKGKV